MKTALLALLGLLACGGLNAQTVLVQPYVQPGDGVALAGTDVKVIAWLTDQQPGAFTVEYESKGVAARTAAPVSVALDFAPKPRPANVLPPPVVVTPATTLDEAKKDPTPDLPEKPQQYLKYHAVLTGLPFDADVTYRVKLGAKLIRDGTFRTRSSAGTSIRFVMIGDLAKGGSAQNGIAFQIAQVQPQFLVALGDIVYPHGRVSQYQRYFWAPYNQPVKASQKTGAPLMRSVPFYPVLGNHDADTNKLTDTPDALGAYYFFHPPLNGPGLGAWNTPIGNSPAAATFRTKVGPTFPALGHYSFDNGPAHFLVLDSNGYNKLNDPKLLAWIEKDLRASTARWKFVCFHAPAFHTSREHYVEQKLRLLQPLFEQTGVDLVFAGHVHNYQRSKPLRFTPNPPVRDARGRVNGTFVLDEKFDGATNTRPDGVIHIVSGGGGASLYSQDFAKTVEFLKKEPSQNWVPFTAKYFAERHSFSVLDLTPQELTLRQIDINGLEIDRIRITK